jgi:hypothetical protein
VLIATNTTSANEVGTKAVPDNIFDEAYSEPLDIVKINLQGRNFILHTSFMFLEVAIFVEFSEN